MTNDKQTELLIDISSKLGSIDAQLKSTNATLVQHEKRISNLENGKTGSVKQDIVTLLAKALTIAVVAIAGLSGTAGIVSKIFGI